MAIMQRKKNRCFGRVSHWILFVSILSQVSSCKRTPHEMEAATDVRTFAEAVLMFRAQYGYDPAPKGGLRAPSCKTVLQVLLAATNSQDATDLNPRHIRFLNLPHRSLGGEFIDPWGSPYRLILSRAGDGATQDEMQAITNPVAVWSCGPNRKDEAGKGDDICSWR
jgi:hypothetical protein